MRALSQRDLEFIGTGESLLLLQVSWADLLSEVEPSIVTVLPKNVLYHVATSEPLTYIILRTMAANLLGMAVWDETNKSYSASRLREAKQATLKLYRIDKTNILAYFK